MADMVRYCLLPTTSTRWRTTPSQLSVTIIQHNCSYPPYVETISQY